MKYELEITLQEEKWWHKYLTRIAKSDYAPCANEKDVQEIIIEASRLEREHWIPRLRHVYANLPLAHREMMRDLIQEMEKKT